MYLFLIIFFASLLGIAFMIGRKLMLIEKGYIFPEEPEMSEAEIAAELGRWAKNGLRKLGFVILVVTIRIYVKITELLKTGYLAGAGKIKELYAKNAPAGAPTSKEVNKFLKMVGEYKRKVRRIKDKIKKEERGL